MTDVRTFTAEDLERVLAEYGPAGREVCVHYNRHNDTWTVKDGGSGLKIAQAERLILTGVRPHVGAGGRERVLRTGARNVHAWLRGVPSEDWSLAPAGSRRRRIRYDPFRGAEFEVQARPDSDDWVPYPGSQVVLFCGRHCWTD